MPEELPLDPVDRTPSPVDRTPSPDVRAASFRNLSQLVAHQAAVRPDRAALVRPAPGRRSLTWSGLERAVSEVASGMAATGLVAGQRVALLGPGSVEFVVAYFAALRAGFVCVPLNPGAEPDELRQMLLDSGARLVLAADGLLTGDGVLAGDGPADLVPGGVVRLPLTEAGLAGLAGRGGVPVASPADPEALAVLLYTAGTSGHPRAAMLTHRALLGHLQHLQDLDLVDDQMVVLALLPLFHVFGLNAVLGNWALAGATLVVAGGMLEGDAEDLLAVVVAERATDLPVAPSVLERLLQQGDALTAALAGVRTVVSGAAPLPAPLGAAFTRRTGLRVEQGYGLTEAGPGVAVTLGGDLHGAGHVGRVLPGVQVRIGDGGDPAEPAEIWVRGDNLFSGYWPDGQDGPDPDGWFATGDVGYLSGEELYLVDRARELVVVDGFNVYPAEVEQVIRELPGVEEAAVVGRTEPGVGEQVVAFVTGRVDEQQVAEHCAAQLPRFKRPVRVQLLDELPRGATGKVRKGALRRLPAPGALTTGGEAGTDG